MNIEKKELLKPKYDIVFQALFEGNKDNITQSLISDILGEKVEIIEIKTDSTIARKYPFEKAGRIDLKTKLKDGTICQVEMQMTDKKNTIKRILYYWSRTYAEQIRRGEDYKELNKTIGIIITNYEVEELKGIENLDSKWQITCNKNDKRLLTDDLELHIIEIPKAKRIIEKEKYNRIAQWLMFLDNPNTERVEEIMKENEEVKKAKSVLYVMSEDEELQRLAELKEKWARDEKSALRSAREDGIEEGKISGERNKTIEIAKKLKDMKLKVEDIKKATGLTKDEIEKL